MLTIKFSIITVTFNAVQWLERTIQSIISQTYSDGISINNIEYIIVDGNSKDGTLDIIRKYESYISRWISESDNGLYDAMNKGLKLATGNYVWFLNAGDTICSENTIREIINNLDKTFLPDIIYGETLIVDTKGNALGMRYLKTPKNLTWQSFCMGMLVCHQSLLVKREIAEYYDLQYKFTADYDWCIRCMKKANFIYNTHLILSCFLEEGISTANRKESLKERYRIMCQYYGVLPTQIRHFWFAVRFFTSKWSRKKYLCSSN